MTSCVFQIGHGPSKARWAIAAAAILLMVSVAQADQTADVRQLLQLKVEFQGKFDRGEFAEAEKIARHMLTIANRAFPDQPGMIAAVQMNLASALDAQWRYAEAGKLHEQILQTIRQYSASNPTAIATAYNNLATNYAQQQRWQEAEPLFKQALKTMEANKLPEYPLLARGIYNLAFAQFQQQRYAEAEPLLKRALAIFESRAPADDQETLNCRELLASIYDATGRAAQAEPLLKQLLAARERTLGPNHFALVGTIFKLVTHYLGQKREDAAQPLVERALTICERTLGPENPQTVDQASMLATICLARGQFAEASRALDRVRPGIEKLDRHDPRAGTLRYARLMIDLLQLKLDDVRRDFETSLAERERQFGPMSPELLSDLQLFAYIQLKVLQDPAAAAALVAKAKKIEAAHPQPSVARGQSLDIYSEVDWQAGDRRQAVGELREAMQIALLQRKEASGAEHDLAKMFASAGELFQRMVAWQIELGNTAEAFRAAELDRARSLLDQMDLAGADLLAGVAPAQATALRQRLLQAEQEVNQVQLRLATVAAATAGGDERNRQLAELQARLLKARAAYAEAYRDIRSLSPAFHQVVNQDREPIALDVLVQSLSDQGTLLLYYMIGQENSYVLAAGPGLPPRVFKLTFSADQQRLLGTVGPAVTSQSLNLILLGRQDPYRSIIDKALAKPIAGTPPPIQPGLWFQVQENDLSRQAIQRLSALWQVLVPDDLRPLVTGEHAKRLLIIPDGALALLPFETLVVEPDDEPRYLLDVGLPTVYAPSATVFDKLARRVTSKQRATPALLTLGDAVYSGEATAARGRSGGNVSNLTRAGFAQRSGLQRLPNTGMESDWVADVFREQGVTTAQLKRQTATEAAVRAGAPGKQFLHLACHGFADQTAGNLFGALAVTVGPQAAGNPADDGLLTLAEIYGLNLQQCELTMLSACETNLGPQQEGEGVWSLARGFLVAGSRRVVASDWLVDDEAGASLISYFCGGVANGLKTAHPDYPQSLRNAKRWIRQQAKWKSPYYWAPFIQVGAN